MAVQQRLLRHKHVIIKQKHNKSLEKKLHILKIIRLIITDIKTKVFHDFL